MVEVLERDTVGETIDATVNYVVNNGEKLFTETAGPGGTDVRTGGTVDPRHVPIHNARLHSDPFVLDREGFRFVRHDTAVADFFDEDQVRRVYYPEMEALVKAESGASRVVVFDHTLRTADDEQREARKIREVVRRVHNDYTEWSGPQRVRDLLPQEADDLLQRRFASSRDDQWVTPNRAGGGRNVSAMIFCWSTILGRPGRSTSTSPAMPAST